MSPVSMSLDVFRLKTFLAAVRCGPAMVGLACLLMGVLAVAAPTVVRAHDIRPAIVDLTVAPDGAVRLEMSLILEAAIARLGADAVEDDTSANVQLYDTLRELEPDELSTRFSPFEAEFADGVRLGADHMPVELAVDSLEIDPVGDADFARLSYVTLSGALPTQTTAVTFAFDSDFGPSVLRVRDGDGEVAYSVYLEAGTTSEAVDITGRLEQSALSVAWNYLGIGFTHILPKGLDHILFVVGLFLLSSRLRPLLVQITCFTIAHTITLAMAMLGWVSISPAIVEPLIAASIVYVAVENMMTRKLHSWRPVVVFGFGLLHGLGFAGVLTEIGLAPSHFVVGLISFNVGVEVGQLAVVAICYGALAVWFDERSWYRTRVTMPLSACIAAIAAFWFFERIGLIA